MICMTKMYFLVYYALKSEKNQVLSAILAEISLKNVMSNRERELTKMKKTVGGGYENE